MSNSSTMFTGTSRYSSDFQQVIDRAVAIASLPMTRLSNEKAALQSESAALTALDEKFTALKTAVAGLESATGSSSWTVSVSNGSALSASLTSEALEATYVVNVTALGSYATTLSKTGLIAVSDPSAQNISGASSFTLTLGGTPHTITPASTTLNGLVAAINDSGYDVRASLINVGTSAAPDYRLSVQGTKLQALTIQLNDGTRDLLDALPPAGAPATFTVNGSGAIQSDSRSVTLAPGVGLVLLSDTAGSSTVTVARTTAALNNSLGAFVTAYNAAVDELDAHRGSAGGALSGQNIVFTLSQALRDVAQYSSGSGSIASLTDLGLNFDDHGKLSFDTSVFATAAANFDNLSAFFGSSTGGGFLKAAEDVMTSLEDSTSGAIKTTMASVSSEIDSYTEQIADQQSRIDLMQADLFERMNKADAMIAALEQQASYMNSLFESMRIAAQSYSK